MTTALALFWCDCVTLAQRITKACYCWLSRVSITNKAERTKIFGQYDHVRIYGMDYFEKLRTIGFQVNELQFGKTLSDEERARYAVVKTEYIPVCERPIEA